MPSYVGCHQKVWPRFSGESRHKTPPTGVPSGLGELIPAVKLATKITQSGSVSVCVSLSLSLPSAFVSLCLHLSSDARGPHLPPCGQNSQR